jgi:hypothetical protein
MDLQNGPPSLPFAGLRRLILFLMYDWVESIWGEIYALACYINWYEQRLRGNH